MNAIAEQAVEIAGPQFTIGLPGMLSALATLNVVSNTPALPILGCTLITTGPDGTTLSAFDYETSVRVVIDDTPHETRPSVAVNLAELSKVCRAATKGESKTTVAGWTANFVSRIWTGARELPEAEVTVARFTLPISCAPNAAMFPALPKPPAPTIRVDRDVLLAALRIVATAVSKDPTLPALHGVHVELSSGVLTLACTDRFRLAVHTVAVTPVADVELRNGTWLLPAAELIAVLKVLPAGPVTMGLPSDRATCAGLSSGGVSATMRPIVAEFPRFRSLLLLPTDAPTVVCVNRAALVKVVAKAAALGSALNTRFVALTASAGRLTVAPHGGGRIRGAHLDALVQGDDQAARFNVRYLAEALGTFSGDTVAFTVAGGTRWPTVLADSSDLLFDAGAACRHLLVRVPTGGAA